MNRIPSISVSPPAFGAWSLRRTALAGATGLGLAGCHRPEPPADNFVSTHVLDNAPQAKPPEPTGLGLRERVDEIEKNNRILILAKKGEIQPDANALKDAALTVYKHREPTVTFSQASVERRTQALNLSQDLKRKFQPLNETQKRDTALALFEVLEDIHGMPTQLTQQYQAKKPFADMSLVERTNRMTTLKTKLALAADKSIELTPDEWRDSASELYQTVERTVTYAHAPLDLRTRAFELNESLNRRHMPLPDAEKAKAALDLFDVLEKALPTPQKATGGRPRL